MVLRVFAVFDTKVGTYAKPFFMQTKGQALRGWSDVVNDPSTEVAKHPEDFVLFELAEYDDASGSFTNHAAPISLGLAIEFQKPNYATMGVNKSETRASREDLLRQSHNE